MKDILMKALQNHGIDTDEVEMQVRLVKYDRMFETDDCKPQAVYWVLCYDADEYLYYITKIYLDMVTLEADFAGQVDYEGHYEEMFNKFKTL